VIFLIVTGQLTFKSVNFPAGTVQRAHTIPGLLSSFHNIQVIMWTVCPSVLYLYLWLQYNCHYQYSLNFLPSLIFPLQHACITSIFHIDVGIIMYNCGVYSCYFTPQIWSQKLIFSQTQTRPKYWTYLMFIGPCVILIVE